MSKNSVLAAALIVLMGAVPVFAQDVRPELSITLGWTFSDGVSGDPVVAGGQIFDRVDPKDSFNWGLGFGFPVNENVELGFLFGQQAPSKLVAGGTSEFEIGDFTTNTYHGYFGYNFGPGDAKVRPVLPLWPRRDELRRHRLHRSERAVWHPRGIHAVLDHLGRRREGLRLRPCRLPGRCVVDPDLHQV